MRESIFFILLFVFYSCNTSDRESVTGSSEPDFLVDTVQTFSKEKLKLTKKYCEDFYGISDYKLESPQIIVIHYTVIPTLSETIDLFKQTELSSNRKYIDNFSKLNVGIHYVIDTDGIIYNLLPDSIIARHIIGFNHVSLGIENVAENEDQLTKMQIASNIKLIKFLKDRHPSIKFLIGHDEYNDTSLPHYKLFRSLDENYRPYDKPDPGTEFMKQIRFRLIKEYGLQLKK